jgi:hypothetical protein
VRIQLSIASFKNLSNDWLNFFLASFFVHCLRLLGPKALIVCGLSYSVVERELLQGGLVKGGGTRVFNVFLEDLVTILFQHNLLLLVLRDRSAQHSWLEMEEGDFAV